MTEYSKNNDRYQITDLLKQPERGKQCIRYRGTKVRITADLSEIMQFKRHL